MNTLIAISGLGIFCLIAEIMNGRKVIVPITILGLLAILGLTINDYNTTSSWYNNMIVVSNFTTIFNSLFIILTIFIIAMSADFYKNSPEKFSDYIAIKIFLLSGAVAMVSFGNLAMFFIGIEVLSIALYILAGSNSRSIESNEAGMKYFLLGSFASGIMLFGICLVYGATGYFDVAEIYLLSNGAGLPVWFSIGITMIVIGMLFKIAAFPFHFWAPDVYEGSPTLVTTLMSTLVKVVAIATLFKILVSLNQSFEPKFYFIIATISVLTMTIGNIMALRQTNVKRMLAFSGISHAGFMLMALLSLNLAANTLFYYATAYSLSGIAAFAIIIYVTNNSDSQKINSFNGLAKTNPLHAAILSLALLSMAGIPILSGFFAKLMLFNQTLSIANGKYIAVVIFGVINSIISIGYYFKLLIAMYTKEATSKPNASIVYTIVAVVATIINLVIGIYPALISNLI